MRAGGPGSHGKDFEGDMKSSEDSEKGNSMMWFKVWEGSCGQCMEGENGDLFRAPCSYPGERWWGWWHPFLIRLSLVHCLVQVKTAVDVIYPYLILIIPLWSLSLICPCGICRTPAPVFPVFISERTLLLFPVERVPLDHQRTSPALGNIFGPCVLVLMTGDTYSKVQRVLACLSPNAKPPRILIYGASFCSFSLLLPWPTGWPDWPAGGPEFQGEVISEKSFPMDMSSYNCWVLRPHYPPSKKMSWPN